MEVAGRSMEPAFTPGDRVRIRRANWYLPGDVVAFLDDHDQPILHRLLGFGIRRHPPMALVVTKGDATDQRDPPVPLESILGRVDPVCWRSRVHGAITATRLLASAVIRRMRGPWSQTP